MRGKDTYEFLPSELRKCPLNQARIEFYCTRSMITSQNVTAPKPLAQIPHCGEDGHPSWHIQWLSRKSWSTSVFRSRTYAIESWLDSNTSTLKR